VKRRFFAVVLCVLVALCAGMLAAAGANAADSPGILSHPAWLWNFALSAAPVYMLVPLAVLAGLMAWGRPVTTGVCVGVTMLWYALVFAGWLSFAWISDGAFPEWGWRHYAVDLLPIPLLMGLAFSMAARRA
jgi:hypothetical protein